MERALGNFGNTGEAQGHPQMKRVQIFIWESPEGEKKYSVDAAIELIAQRGLQPQCNISLEDAKEGLRRNYRSAELKNEHIAKADLNEPLIFITLWTPSEGRYTNVLIDGWHRAKKMVLLGRTEPLKAYILSPTETQCIEIAEIIYQ